MTRLSDLTIAVVTHNNADTISSCIGALLDGGIKVIVVDSGSTDGTAEVASHLGARVIRSNNLGFGTGCNRAAREASTDLIMFLNPDAAATIDHICQMHQLWHGLNQAGHRPVIGPKFEGEDPETGDSYRLWFYSSSLAVRKRLFREKAVADSSVIGRHILIPQRISGAAFLMGRTDFLAIGGFDEKFFLYFEDSELSIRLVAGGYFLSVHPDVEIGHVREHSTGQLNNLNQIRTRSAALMTRKHRGRIGLALFVLDAVAINFAAAFVSILSGRPRTAAERISRLRALRDLRSIQSSSIHKGSR